MPILLFVIVGALSLKLTTTANQVVGGWLFHHIPAAGWLADSVLPSLLASIAIYCAIKPKHLLSLPDQQTSWPAILRVGGSWLVAWLIGSAVAAIAVGHWIGYTYATHNMAEMLGFALVAPLAEETIIRGALFELAERAFGSNPRFAVLCTSLLFSLFHLQFHAFRLNLAAIGQLLFTIPMGLVLGTLRRDSKSIWPGVVVHILTNIPGLFGASGGRNSAGRWNHGSGAVTCALDEWSGRWCGRSGGNCGDAFSGLAEESAYGDCRAERHQRGDFESGG